MTQLPANPNLEFLSNLAADSLEQMEGDRQVFQQRMSDSQIAVDNSANRIMQRLSARRNPQPQGPVYSEEVKGIANMLTQFPKMVPVVKAVLYKLTAEMDKAFNDTANQYLSDPVIQDLIKQQQAAAAAAQANGGTT